MFQRPFKLTQEESKQPRPVALLDSSFLLSMGHEAGGIEAAMMSTLNAAGTSFAISATPMRQLRQATLDLDDAIRGLAKGVLRSLGRWDIHLWSLDLHQTVQIEAKSSEILKSNCFNLDRDEIRIILESSMMRVDFLVTDRRKFIEIDISKLNEMLAYFEFPDLKICTPPSAMKA